jgi:hypothetical protein
VEGLAIRLDDSPVRCPFCHDRIEADGEPWVACSACLARHHPECWTEASSCASCRSASALVAAPPLIRRAIRVTAVGRLRRRQRARTRRRVLGALIVASVAVNVVLVVLGFGTTALLPFSYSSF